jgi:hypothetical protein
VLNPKDRSIEEYFSREENRLLFPLFCNSLIALEAPQTRTFPILTSRPGPDGGIDGEWELTGAVTSESAVAVDGWNVYQFKTADAVTQGEKEAFSELCQKVRGAVADLLNRQTEPKILGRYYLFVNLRLGPESEATTRQGSKVNTRRQKLRTALLDGASKKTDVAIIDAAQIAGFCIRHPVLGRAWFAANLAQPWIRMQQQEKRLSAVEVGFVGRDDELATLQQWIRDPDIRVISISGPNSIGKTRTVIEATKDHAAITFFFEDVHSLLADGVELYATPERPIVLVVDDPAIEDARRLARQCVASSKPIKLIATLPSPRHAPVIRLGDDRFEKRVQFEPLKKEVATKLITSVNPTLTARMRDWILHQAGGIPGIIVAASRLGDSLRTDADSFREQLSSPLKQKCISSVGREGLEVLQAVSALTYVYTSSGVCELETLLSFISPDTKVLRARNLLDELDAAGFIRRQGDYATVIPPMFAASLFHAVVRQDPTVPRRIFEELDAQGKLRFLDRVVTIEPSDDLEFSEYLFGTEGPFRNQAQFRKHVSLLEHVARAFPEATVRFLQKNIEQIWESITSDQRETTSHLLLALNELLDDPSTAPIAFAVLTDLAERETLLSQGTAIADDLVECFVYWYPRSIRYEEREASVDAMLQSKSGLLRRLAARAIAISTNPPRTLSGRSVALRRFGGEPSYGTWGDCWDFLFRMLARRIALCSDPDREVLGLAVGDFSHAVSSVTEEMPAEKALKWVKAIVGPFLKSRLKLDPSALRDSVRWLRDRFEGRRTSVPQPRIAEFNRVVYGLNRILQRLEKGPFAYRLRLALGRDFDRDELGLFHLCSVGRVGESGLELTGSGCGAK